MNIASWHKSCRQLYRASALDNALKVCHNEGLPPVKKDPGGVMKLLIVISVSSVVMKQMVHTILVPIIAIS